MPIVLNAVEELMHYLAHSAHGVSELWYEPSDGGAPHIGFFDSLDMLLATVEDHADSGRLSVGVQPRPAEVMDRAPNRLRRSVTSITSGEITHFLTAAVNVYLPDEDQRDSTTVAWRIIRGGTTKPHCVRLSDSSCTLLIAVPAIEIQDHTDLLSQLTQYAREIHTHVAIPDARIRGPENLAERIVLTDLRTEHRAARTESPKLGRRLHRTLPPTVLDLVNRAPNGRLAKLFRGEGPIGVDNQGRARERTAAAYDSAFVQQLIRQGGRRVVRDDLVDALWNRPGSAAKQLGLGAVYDVVDAALDEAAEPPPAQDDNAPPAPAGGPPEMPVQVYAPEVSLRNRLNGDYYRWSDRSDAYVHRDDIDTTVKAEKVVDFLLQQGAEFYFFEATNEVVFVLDHKQYVVHRHDQAYSQWFLNNVRMFSVQDQRGKELTEAVRMAILDNEATIKAKRSRWGHFDRSPEAPALYYCLDPEHATLIRIRPAGPDGAPRVDEIANGEDGVTLRAPMGRGRRFEYVPGAMAGDGFKYFRDEVHAGQALKPLSRIMSTMFNLSTLIPDHGQRPIKFHRGPAGSGKTYAAYDFEIVYYGQRYSRDYDDVASFLKALKEAGPFVTFDNAESDVRRRFRKHYLPASTGSSSARRVLYTTDEQAVYEPNGSICLTAIEGVSKEEEIRRMFEYAFSDEHHDTVDRPDPTSRDMALREHADLMLSAVFEAVSVYLLPNWSQRYSAAVRYVTRDCPRTSKKAFNDYLAWMLLWTESIGKYLWQESETFEARAMFQRYMTSMADQDIVARVAGDPVMSCLEALRHVAVASLTSQPGYLSEVRAAYFYEVRVERTPDGSLTVGPFTTSMLSRCFNRIAKEAGLYLPYKDGRILGHRMTGLAKDPAFAAVGWRRERLPERAHKNQNKYVLTWTPSEPFVLPAAPGDSGVLDDSSS